MKYPEALHHKINTDYFLRFEQLKIDHPEKTNREIYIILETEGDHEYFTSYSSFRNGLCKYRKAKRKKSKS